MNPEDGTNHKGLWRPEPHQVELDANETTTTSGLIEDASSRPSPVGGTLSAGVDAPIKGEERDKSLRASLRLDRVSQRSGNGFDFEALKIFLILTVLTVMMVLIARWMI